MFKILKKDKSAGRRTKARLGVLKTPHGTVKTPSYVIVGTYGRIRNLTASDIKKTGTQLIISNTFHLWKKALELKYGGKSVLADLGKIPTMTDSGGFQVLSLAFGNDNKVGKFLNDSAKPGADYVRKNIRITDKGVHFTYMGKKMFLGPDKSMDIQKKIGADIIFAFDHITSPLDDYDYNLKAVELTDKWAGQCIKRHKKNTLLRKQSGEPKQSLFGIVQGGIFKDLRIASAKSIGSMEFDGFGIGGSYTKKQISKILKWVIPHLPEEKPRHLLGVGKIDDIFEAIENGIDTFDCVIPTREARHGRLYTRKGTIDIRRGYFSNDKKVIEPGCGCPTCKPAGGQVGRGITRSEVRRLLKSQVPEEKALGQRWCLMHNMWFYNNLLENIRNSLQKNRYHQFKKKFLAQYKK